MKKYLWILVIAFAVASCGGPSDAELQAERDSLQNIIDNQEGTLNDFFSSLNEIEQNLSTIKEKENIIRVDASNDMELSENAKDRINEDILLIYELMLKNKQSLETMQSKLKKSNLRVKELEKTIQNYVAQMEKKDQEINTLKNQLSNMNILVADLNANIAKLAASMDSISTEDQTKTETITQQTEALNTGFYVYGTVKELKEQGVITKEGGFIGMGRMEKLKDNFNKDYFTKIDITKTQSIPIFAKKAKIITTHPASSYELKGGKEVDSVVITNAKDFWSVSKYLVIVIN